MMNPKHYYHTPIKPISTRVSCPVCHNAVYSRAGIHPQCAVIQYDPPKVRGKKQPVPLLDQAIEAIDRPSPDVVVEPLAVKPAAVPQPRIAPVAAKGGRIGQKRVATAKRARVPSVV